MSILTSKLPDGFIIDGKKYLINTDFRVWLQFSSIITDSSVNLFTRLGKAMALIYSEIPPTYEQALSHVMEFYAGSVLDENRSTDRSEAKQLYDFEYDANAIYASFLQEYGIDLCTASLHWWQFKALFSSLGENTRMSKIMQYRSMDLRKIKDKETKSFYRKMKKIHALPDNRSQEQKETEIADALFSI